LIQLQMPINPGNSGGPVLDDSGRVVGISQSIMASGQAIAFCLPINIIKSMIPQLLSKGQIERAFLGVEPTDLTPEFAKELGLNQNEKGAVLVQVIPDTPAEKAGLRPMDVILEIDGQKVTDAFNLRQQTAYKEIGKSVKVKLYRKGVGIREALVRLEKRPGENAPLSRTERGEVAAIALDSVGLEVRDTPEQVQKELGLSSANRGALVVGFMRRSSGEFAGFQPGDVITKVDGTPISSATQLQEIVAKAPKGKTFMMISRRGKAERFVPLTKR